MFKRYEYIMFLKAGWIKSTIILQPVIFFGLKECGKFGLERNRVSTFIV